MGLLIGRGAADFGLFIVLLFFIFIPGVYFVANTPNWGKLARASASLGYVAAAEVIARGIAFGFISEKKCRARSLRS